MNTKPFDAAVIGCGSIGIATAYYLARHPDFRRIALIDCGQPMAFTSAQSGENYRNWWPHPTMVAFINRSIDLMEEIAEQSDNRINMTRRGYALVTRETEISDLLDQLHDSQGDLTATPIRVHEHAQSRSYQRPVSPDWNTAPTGVDVLHHPALIRATFPSYATDVQAVVHIRRGGDISGQQLGAFMLESLKASGAQRVAGGVTAIRAGEPFTLELESQGRTQSIAARTVINAAGPFANTIADMLDITLPVHNTFQQKIAFDDKARAIPRDLPFSIDLDAQDLDWEADEREMLREDADLSWLADTLPGSIHCRPDGGDHGSWVKLGWAYNRTPEPVVRERALDEYYPDIVLRGAARLNPSLKTYYGQLPRNRHHYGGWYTMTEENWPLIGPMDPAGTVDGAYMNCAMSGFGTMAACAAGELCASWIAGTPLPSYAHALSIYRYADAPLMEQLWAADKGLL